MIARSGFPLATAVAVAIIFGWLPSWGQTPGTYPPSTYPPDTTQYPPNQYPPGQYPPNQYPPNQYPARLPGGVPIGIPIPEIKLPKRKPKDEGGVKSSVVEMRGIEGNLRRLGEKDLVAETKEKGILQFRVLAKTKFVDAAGEPIRDSLLKPGDRIRIEATADDEETAIRVTLLRKGTAAERTAAEKPVDAASIKTPEGLPRSTSAPPAPSREIATAAPDDGRPSLPRGLPAPAASPENASSAVPTAVDSDIEEAREAAAKFSDTLPNYLVQQITTRYVSTTQPPQWRALDVVSAEVACVNGAEEYRNVTVNGRPAQRPVEKTGSWSTGEFATTLQDILSPLTNATFKRLGEQTVGSRLVVVYEYAVKQPNSHWTIVGEAHNYNPAFTGVLYIDRQTHRVLRIEQFAQAIPSDFPYDRAESIVDYDYVAVERNLHLLPTRSESLICKRGTATCTRNEIEFRNYRKFAAESEITFQKLIGGDD